jgi:hypothetical protein
VRLKKLHTKQNDSSIAERSCVAQWRYCRCGTNHAAALLPALAANAPLLSHVHAHRSQANDISGNKHRKQ